MLFLYKYLKWEVYLYEFIYGQFHPFYNEINFKNKSNEIFGRILFTRSQSIFKGKMIYMFFNSGLRLNSQINHERHAGSREWFGLRYFSPDFLCLVWEYFFHFSLMKAFPLLSLSLSHQDPLLKLFLLKIVLLFVFYFILFLLLLYPFCTSFLPP